MRIRKYDFDYSRRVLMEKTAKGIGTAGVLGSFWPTLAKGESTDIKMAYPEESLSIEAHTKGKIKPGDTITADNLEHVEHCSTRLPWKRSRTTVARSRFGKRPPM